MKKIVLGFILFLFVYGFEEENETYKGMVVEYYPLCYDPSMGILSQKEAFDRIILPNLEDYNIICQNASSIGVDIIVFPEDGLYGWNFPSREMIFPFLEDIPMPNNSYSSGLDGMVPCDNDNFLDRPVLQYLSCMARNNGLAVVVNMGDVKYCLPNDDDCPLDKKYQYNTAVSFDSTGEILAVYHKSHLYYETQFNQPKVPKAVWFTPSFGVTFGIFICYDIQFAYPALELIQDYGIKNFVYPLWWVNDPPMKTAIQFQQSWSRVMEVNLLAASSGYRNTTSGSGIWSSGNPLKYYYNPLKHIGDTKYVYSNIPKLPLSSKSQSQSQSQSLAKSKAKAKKVEMEMDIEEIQLSPFLPEIDKEGVVFASVPSRNLSCKATYSVNNNNNNGNEDEIYALMARYWIGADFNQYRDCCLTKCVNHIIRNNSNINNLTCILGYTIESQVSFNQFFIEMEPVEGLMVFPYASGNNGKVFEKNDLIFSGYKLKSSSNFSSPILDVCLTHIKFDQ